MQGRSVIFDREELERACARMDELSGEQPDRHPVDIAEQVIREMGKQAFRDVVSRPSKHETPLKNQTGEFLPY